MTPRTAKRPRPSYAESPTSSPSSSSSAASPSPSRALDEHDDDDDDAPPSSSSRPSARKRGVERKPAARAKPSSAKATTGRSAKPSSRPASSKSDARRGAKRRATTKADEDEEEFDDQGGEDDDDDEDDAGEDADRASGQEFTNGNGRAVTVLKLVGAPKTGHVPAGQLSPNTLAFLEDLCDPRKNDREWFALNQKRYEYALNNFKAFGEKLLDDFLERVDDTLPWMPVKDWIYRIYRDIRFSNDKTPYKTNFCATFSRGGRKGPFAGYHIVVRGDHIDFHAGVWCPEKRELGKIREHILGATPLAKRLKEVIASDDFVAHFGPPRPSARTKPSGEAVRQSLWGTEWELKRAPKIAGVDAAAHADIDLLRLKGFVVTQSLPRKQVLSPDVRDYVVAVAKAAQPLVETLNAIMFDEEL